MATLNDLSVIVAVDPNDVSWIQLGLDLKSLPQNSEILFVGTQLPQAGTQVISQLSTVHSVRWILEGGGLLAQFGAGARASTKNLIWFLPGQAKPTRQSLISLEKSIRANPRAIHYFNLMADEEAHVRLSPKEKLDLWVKSTLLRLPGGFQGLCVPRDVYFQLGGFQPGAGHPNEPAFIRMAKKSGISILCTGADLGI